MDSVGGRRPFAYGDVLCIHGAGGRAGDWALVGAEFEAQGHDVVAMDLADHSEHSLFTHDVPAAVLESMEPPRDQTATLFDEPWPLDAWPDVPICFLLCRDDRFFPPEWMRGVVADRLGIEPIEIPGSHCAYLSQPRPLAEAILRCKADPKEHWSIPPTMERGSPARTDDRTAPPDL